MHVGFPGLRSGFFFFLIRVLHLSVFLSLRRVKYFRSYSILRLHVFHAYHCLTLFSVFLTVGAPSGAPFRFSQLFDFSDTDLPCLALPCV